MHELAVCQDIIAQVENIAREHNAISVCQVTLDIGPLSGVEAALLTAAFPVASAGTVAESARLEIQNIPVTVSCSLCQEQSTVSSNNLSCRHCGNWKTRLVSGDEMLLRRIEMDTRE